MPETSQLFASLVRQRLSEKDLSVKAGAKRIHVAHTTLIRALKGKSVDLRTVFRICDALNISPVGFLSTEPSTGSPLASQLAMVLMQTPALAEAFGKAMTEIADGAVSSELIVDIAAYAAFRISLAPGKHSHHTDTRARGSG